MEGDENCWQPAMYSIVCIGMKFPVNVPSFSFYRFYFVVLILTEASNCIQLGLKQPSLLVNSVHRL